jgi:hypothetical protein
VVGFVGGSVTQGQGAKPPLHKSYPDRFVDSLREAFPGSNVEAFNGAVAATGSSYASVCLNQHLPQDADLVIIGEPRHALNCMIRPAPGIKRVSYFSLGQSKGADTCLGTLTLSCSCSMSSWKTLYWTHHRWREHGKRHLLQDADPVLIDVCMHGR